MVRETTVLPYIASLMGISLLLAALEHGRIGKIKLIVDMGFAHLGVVLMLSCISIEALRASTFQDSFSVTWAEDHVQTNGVNGSTVELLLDETSGSAFSSNKKYMFGYIGMNLKLVAGNSAGIVTAYYLSSEGKDHDELDFEFLGNRSGQPYVLQTNIYGNGKGGREQRISLWFDPSEDYHTYSFLWNKQLTVFYVDRTPVRMLRNVKATSEMYPSHRPMRLISSIWNADNWATRGGIDKIDWNGAPFVASFKGFNVDACTENDSECVATGMESRWWDQPEVRSLSNVERRKYNWVRFKLLIYDYCLDTRRYPSPPSECTDAAP